MAPTADFLYDLYGKAVTSAPLLGRQVAIMTEAPPDNDEIRAGA